ncbi:MAG TPA: A24 family peptidase [Dehalococcoidia bacterium]|nr:A24 family peptidase [Dehalococcoidia bacterium]
MRSLGATRLDAGVAAIAAAVGAVAAVADDRSVGGVAVMVAFFAALGAVSVIDARERRIPNAYTSAGTALAVVAAAFGGLDAVASALGGIAVGGGVMGLFFVIVFVIGRGSLGLGDVWFSTFVGAVLGIPATATFLFLGTAFGALGALVLLARGYDRHSTIAYGPYLAAGAAVTAASIGPVVG